jgi:SAM-dependent methyltransferase
MYVTKERKCSSIKGTGIQYIPGHDEKFIDFVIEKYLPEAGNIVDLGGGGLRFAIPVSLTGKKITVVDMDRDALDLTGIVKRINANGKLFIDCEKIRNLIEIHVQDIFRFLRMTRETYDLISAFRVLHFLTPEQMNELFSLVSRRLNPGGLLAISAITLFDRSKSKDYNEFFLNSSAADPDNFLYRKFHDHAEANHIREEQNLSPCLHFIDRPFVESMAERYGFDLVEWDVPSTRVVSGYVLKRGL